MVNDFYENMPDNKEVLDHLEFIESNLTDCLRRIKNLESQISDIRRIVRSNRN